MTSMNSFAQYQRRRVTKSTNIGCNSLAYAKIVNKLQEKITVYRLLSILAILTLALSSCDLPFSSQAPEVLTTTTILADVTRNVIGDRFSVGALLPIGADPHS